MKHTKVAVLATACLSSANPAASEVIIHCGPSEGTSYFFRQEFLNPDGPSWEDDGISNGRIILVREGDEWDILFGDIAGNYGYRQDGAEVLLLNSNEGFLTVGAFSNNYVEIYTFNLIDREVAWTSHKTGTPIPKVAAYHADCG